jgi:hypothetical protein
MGSGRTRKGKRRPKRTPLEANTFAAARLEADKLEKEPRLRLSLTRIVSGPTPP